MRQVASLAERYHEVTKYTPERLGRHAGLDFAAQPSPFKEWYQAQVVLLPGGARGAGRPSKGPLDLERLGRLLFHTYGVTRVSQAAGSTHHFRASPSAGGLYPAELYVAVHGVAGVPDGIHDYLAREHALALCWEGDFRAELARYAFGHPAIASARVVLIATAVFQRSAWRYQDRAYRRVLLDTGHMLANAALAAPADGLRVVPVADFVDDGVDGLLLLEPGAEGALLLGAVLEDATSLPAPRLPRRSRVERGGPEPTEGAWIRALHDASRLRDDEPPRDEGAGSKVPPGGEPVILDSAPLPGGAAVHEAIRRRRSTRQFRTGPFPLEDVGRILAHATGGAAAGPQAADAAPILAPDLLATRLVVGGVEGLASGVYAYEAARHALRPVRLGNPRAALYDACLQQELGRDCAFAVVRTFDLPAAVERFGERAYRYAHLQAGLDGERLDLAALRLGHGASGIGGFFDDFLTGLLGLPPEHAVAYLTTIGVAV
jgi:SagB-type dehydrogenase family enzyme